MIRFRIGRIPVEVQPSHFLIGGLFGYFFVSGGTPFSIQLIAERIGVPVSAAYAVAIGAWMMIIFASILVHELGHATVGALYKYSPEITLADLGGHTRSHPPEP